MFNNASAKPLSIARTLPINCVPKWRGVGVYKGRYFILAAKTSSKYADLKPILMHTHPPRESEVPLSRATHARYQTNFALVGEGDLGGEVMATVSTPVLFTENCQPTTANWNFR